MRELKIKYKTDGSLEIFLKQHLTKDFFFFNYFSSDSTSQWENGQLSIR